MEEVVNLNYENDYERSIKCHFYDHMTCFNRDQMFACSYMLKTLKRITMAVLITKSATQIKVYAEINILLTAIFK